MKNLLFLYCCFLLVQCTPDQKDASNSILSTSNLPTQVFTINPTADTIVYGRDGTKLTIPKNVFVCKNGKAITDKIQLELKEAIQLKDMVLGGLYTLSFEDKILSSNGMIYLEAQSESCGQLKLRKGSAIEVQIPNAAVKEGLKVFEGVEKDGMVKWLEISKLDYKEKLSQLSVGEKKFKKYCATCHANNLRQDGTGPALGNVHLYRSKDWFRRFTRNSQQMIAARDSLAVCLWQEWKPTVMPSFSTSDDPDDPNNYNNGSPELSDNEIDWIYDYLANESVVQGFDSTEIEYTMSCVITDNVAFQNEVQQFPIPPSNLYPIPIHIVSNVFEQKRLGWSNIDRFWNDSKTKPMEFFVQVDSKIERINVSIVFQLDKAYLPSFWYKENLYSFTHNEYEKMTTLPIGEHAIIIATAIETDSVWFGYKEITYGDNTIEKVQLNPSSEKEIKETLERLLE